MKTTLEAAGFYQQLYARNARDFKWYQHHWKADMRYEYFDIPKQFELVFELSLPVNETKFSEALTKNEAFFT